jgi:hypothetical protein
MGQEFSRLHVAQTGLRDHPAFYPIPNGDKATRGMKLITHLQIEYLDLTRVHPLPDMSSWRRVYLVTHRQFYCYFFFVIASQSLSLVLLLLLYFFFFNFIYVSFHISSSFLPIKVSPKVTFPILQIQNL